MKGVTKIIYLYILISGFYQFYNLKLGIRYTAVQLMGSGMTPSNAALFSIKPIIKFYPDFNGAVIAVNSKGEHGS